MGDGLDAFVALAETLAETSGPIARGYFRSGLAVEDKPDDTPVTLADREAESAMRVLIEKHYPEHGIIGEEFGSVGADRDTIWVLDPIDGTLPFLAGIPVFGTLIALVRGGTPVIGVIDLPATGDGISMLALSLSRVINDCSAATVSPAATSTSITSTESNSPRSGTRTSKPLTKSSSARRKARP